jgi:RHS repeat-associated protein
LNTFLNNIEKFDQSPSMTYGAKERPYLDYHPFGMIMSGRSANSAEYRYGFGGYEKDDEIKGEGNSVNYKYRMHDPRIGRFFAVDPLAAKYPYYSPYSFSGNRVIDAAELEGLEPELVTETAEEYEDTPYEFGGKDPAFEGGLPEDMTEDWYLDNVGWPSSQNRSRYSNPNYSNEINLNKYFGLIIYFPYLMLLKH